MRRAVAELPLLVVALILLSTGADLLPPDAIVDAGAVELDLTRLLILAGLAALVGGSLLLSRISVTGSYASDVLPGMTLFAVGLAFSYTTTTIGGTAGVPDADQGLAGGLLNTFNQVGGAVGLAVLATVAATVTERAAAPGDAALVDGLRGAFLAALAFAALGVVTATTLIRGRDCERELARRQSEDGAPLDATAAGCLAGLGARVIDDPARDYARA